MDNQSLMKEVIRSKNYLKINKNLIQCLGLETAVYLGMLADKEEYFEKREKYTGWFFQRQEDLSLQIGLSEYQLRKCKQKCKELGLLETEMKGLPAKEWYCLDWDRIGEVYSQFMAIPKETKPFRNSTPIPKETRGIKPKETRGIYKEPNNEPKSKKTKVNLSCLDREVEIRVRKRNNPPEPETKQSTPYQEIKDAWNRITKDTQLLPITKITDNRRKHIKARSTTLPTLTHWKKLFRKIIKSPFLCKGDNFFSFDWLIKNEDNLTKTLEGKYDKDFSQPTLKKNGNNGVRFQMERTKQASTPQYDCIVINNDYEPPQPPAPIQ